MDCIVYGVAKSWTWLSDFHFTSRSREKGISLCPYTHQGEAMWAHSKKVAVCEPGREPSLESEQAGTLILDLQTPELWENNCSLLVFCCDSPSGLSTSSSGLTWSISRAVILFLSSLASIIPDSLGLLIPFSISLQPPLKDQGSLKCYSFSPFLSTLKTPCSWVYSLGITIGLHSLACQKCEFQASPRPAEWTLTLTGDAHKRLKVLLSKISVTNSVLWFFQVHIWSGY